MMKTNETDTLAGIIESVRELRKELGDLEKTLKKMSRPTCSAEKLPTAGKEDSDG